MFTAEAMFATSRNMTFGAIFNILYTPCKFWKT